MTNQRSESMDTVIKENTSNLSIDQVNFHEVMYEKIFQQQEEEYKRAVLGLGEYRLAHSFRKYSVDPLVWVQKTEEQKRAHLQKIFREPNVDELNDVITKHLSITVENSSLSCLLAYLLSSMWRKAEIILSNYSITSLRGRVYSVAEYRHSMTWKSKPKEISCVNAPFSRAPAGFVVIVWLSESILDS